MRGTSCDRSSEASSIKRALCSHECSVWPSRSQDWRRHSGSLKRGWRNMARWTAKQSMLPKLHRPLKLLDKCAPELSEPCRGQLAVQQFRTQARAARTIGIKETPPAIGRTCIDGRATRSQTLRSFCSLGSKSLGALPETMSSPQCVWRSKLLAMHTHTHKVLQRRTQAAMMRRMKLWLKRHEARRRQPLLRRTEVTRPTHCIQMWRMVRSRCEGRAS
mmetsp:Transcript_63063/g.150282  ORF Transcript_63063/g.150282 Transcript_63063/m.150282 type:complete len:218 (+) Transcript_63063:381-1034(+)